MNRELMTGLIPLFAVIIASYPLGRHLGLQGREKLDELYESDRTFHLQIGWY